MAFLGDALRNPRQAFDRARNEAYWWPACGLTAALVLLGYFADPYTTVPMVVGVPIVTGLGLLVYLLLTAMVRGVCGGGGADLGATASQAALVAGAINIPSEALGLVIGADAVLVVVAAGVCGLVSVGYLTVLYSAAFEVGIGRALGGVVVGCLVLIVVVFCVAGCMELVAAGSTPHAR